MKNYTNPNTIINHDNSIIIERPIVKEDEKYYSQVVILRGKWLEKARRWPGFSNLEDALCLPPLVADTVALMGIGKYFQPFIRDEEAACECFEYEHDSYLELIKLLRSLIKEICKKRNKRMEEEIKKLIDLNPLVSHLRLGDA